MPKKAGINTEEATLRVALKESDFKDLVEQLEKDEWNHPVFWRLRTKWAEHLRGQEAKAQEAAATTPRKRAAS